jgi:hypothetical protein
MIPEAVMNNEITQLKKLDLSSNLMSKAKTLVLPERKHGDPTSYAEEFCYRIAELVNWDHLAPFEKHDRPKRLVYLNLSKMNLGEYVLLLSSAFRNSKSLSSIRLSDN